MQKHLRFSMKFIKRNYSRPDWALLPIFKDRNIIGKYNYVPTTLYRIQSSVETTVTVFSEKLLEKGFMEPFDVYVHPDGKVHPLPSDTTIYHGPNGVYLGPIHIQFLLELESSGANCIFKLPKGTAIPNDLVLVHETSERYSLQTTIPRTLKEYQHAVTEFFSTMELLSKTTFLQQIGFYR